MPVPSALECLRCQEQFPVVPMPGGCPSCSAEGTPSNTAPVYARMTAVRPGKQSGRGVARYAAQLPVTRERLVSLGEGDTPLLPAPALGAEFGIRRLVLKDERRNPTGSWRDRFAALAVSLAPDDATLGSSGDDALSLSLAAYAARAGRRSVCLVDPAVPARIRDGVEAVGGRMVAVRSEDDRWPLLADAERVLGWRVVSNRSRPPIGGDPLAVEGYRTIAFEIVESMRFACPDFVAVPAALGDGIQGIWRGFRDLAIWGAVDRIPRMVAVEIAGAVASALAGGRDWVMPSPPTDTAARSLAGPTGTIQSLHAVMESEGLVVRVSEAELEQARIALGEHEGIWADLAAAAPVAAAIKLAVRGEIPARAVFAAVVTTHGALDESSGTPGALETVERSVDELLRALAVRGSP